MKRALLFLSLVACTGQVGKPGTTPIGKAPMAMSVELVDWNPGHADVGKVAAVAEVGETSIVYGDKGLFVFSGGAVSANDATVSKWTYAATIPAGDGSGTTWAVGLDDKGRVLRLMAQMEVEDVSDRYGLANTKVNAVVAMGRYVGFALDNQVAIADGSTVERFDLGLHAVSGGSAKLAGIKQDGSVILFDAMKMTVTTWAVKNATLTAVDAKGHLVVSSSEGILLQADDNSLQRVLDTKGAPVHGMTTSGSRTWIAFGSELGAFDDQFVWVTQNAKVAMDATIHPTPTGDLWAITNGTLLRYTIPVTGDEALWRKTVQPVYARVCSDCHAPGGTSGIDLSSYNAWLARRSLIYDRVVVKKNMPQGRTLEAADLDVIASWSKPN